jgi:hypothetical protein
LICEVPQGQRVKAALGAPGQVAAQVRFGVLVGGTLEAGQVGGTASRSWSVNGAGRWEGAEVISKKFFMP